MALEWVVLGCTAVAEGIMLLLLTLPGLERLRPGLVALTRSALKIMLSFCLFLLMDIYWKYESRPTCGHVCSLTEHLHYKKSTLKSQHNAILIASTLLVNWLLFFVSGLVVRIDQLSKRVEKLSG
ncbi:hypothetical protein HPP92_023938 [Vanilla planifolia]|uniref:Endoplasmic reticulum transmembrane protein n=1 Tax=Vanilla planifolia TaxID=51239 RepID=A0A835PPD3_VANPL|nr:hypothetical protein HPP92_023938 [Vanilla planifolia]